MKRKIASLTILALVLVLAVLAAKALLIGSAQQNWHSAEFLSTLAEDFNKRPKDPNSAVQLTRCYGLEGVLACDYRLPKNVAADVNVPEFVAGVRANVMARGLCRAPEMKEVLGQGVKLQFSYTDMNDAPITSIHLTRADCTP